MTTRTWRPGRTPGAGRTCGCSMPPPGPSASASSRTARHSQVAVRVAVGDVTGDGVADIITAAGPGGGPHVKVFSGVDGSLVASFFAYGASFSGGVFLAVGNFDADPQLEIVTGAGAGGWPHVRVFDVNGGSGDPAGRFPGWLLRVRGVVLGRGQRGGGERGRGRVSTRVITGAGGRRRAAREGVPRRRLARREFLLRTLPCSPAGCTWPPATPTGTAAPRSSPAPAAAAGGRWSMCSRPTPRSSGISPRTPVFAGPVRVTFESVGGAAEIVTGPGSGLGPRVRRFSAATLGLLAEFDAYSPAFLGGIFVGGN